jgi:hypothetical protein
MRKKEEKSKGDKNAERAFLYHLIPGLSTFKKNVTIQKKKPGWISLYGNCARR